MADAKKNESNGIYQSVAERRRRRLQYLEEYRSDHYGRLHRQVWNELNPDYYTKWRENHSGYHVRYCKKWRNNNRHYTKNKNREWAKKHPDYFRKYRKRNKKRLRKYWREYKRRMRANAQSKPL